MGVTYVWWSDDMDEKCYVGAQVYGEYRECGGVCQWYSVCDGVIHLGGEDVLGVEAMGGAYVVWQNMCVFEYMFGRPGCGEARVRPVRDTYEVLVEDVLIYYLARGRQFV